MRVLLIARYFAPVVGGVEVHMKNLGLELVRKGHQVGVIATDWDLKGNRLPRRAMVEGIEVQRLASPVSLFSVLRTWKGDIVHLHLYRSLFPAIASLASAFHHHRVVLTPHCVYPPRSLGDLLLKRSYDLSLGRMMLRSARAIVSLTENDRKDILRLGADPGKLYMIPNSIRWAEFSEPESPEPFRERYRVSQRFLLYVGRIDWNKGLESLVLAVPRLKSLGLSLVIVGEDLGFRKRLEKLAQDLGVANDVLFTGLVDDRVVKSAYAAAAMVVLPSLYEGLPTVVLEAMACGKAVLAAATGGTKHVIMDGQNGFLFPYQDSNEIVRKVERCLAIGLAEVGRNARKTVEESYTWEKSADRLEELYARVSGAASGPARREYVPSPD